MREELKSKIPTDLKNCYSWDVASDLSLGIALASVLANTSLDHDFQNWYQDHVKSEGTDDFANVCRRLGDGKYLLPTFAGLALVGAMNDHTECGSVLGEWGARTTRGYLAGAPTLLLLQFGLGGSRPGESSYHSRWRPFEDAHAVSGHAFMGGVPLITAAKMTDDPYLKALLYTASTLPAWSRIDHNAHYLSQAWLGWWMAYLTCRAIDKTEHEWDHLTLMPVTTAEMIGVGVVYER